MDTQPTSLLTLLHRGGNFAYYWTDAGKTSLWFDISKGEPNPPRNWKNVYFGVHPTRVIPTTNRKGEPKPPEEVRSQNKVIAAVNCLFAEWDAKDYAGGKDEAMEHIKSLEFPPTCLIDSGGGYHGYWMLDDPFIIHDEEEQKYIADIQARWVTFVGSDDGAKDLARVLRVPGTRNYKYTPAPIVTIIYQDEDGYQLRDLARMLPKIEKPQPLPAPAKIDRPTTEKINPGAYFLSKYLAEAQPGNRNKKGLALACQLRDSQVPESEARQIMKDYASRVRGEGYTEDEAITSLESAYSTSARKPAVLDRRERQPDPEPPEMPWGEGLLTERPTETQTQERQETSGDDANKKPHPKSIDYVEALKKLGYEFRQNECSDRTEVNGEPITDSLECVIFSKLRDRGMPMVNVARDAYIAHAYYNSYHPIRDYLSKLKWDGGQHIHALAGYFTNDDCTFETWLRRWLIGSVRRAFEPGAQNRVLVLDGPQNMGKSKFTEWLAPTELRAKYYKVAPISPDDKDCRLALCERWIWEIAELGATTRRADREALKAFISMEHVTLRPAYGRYEMSKPALSNFIGTVNNENGLLSDPTGNRRYMFTKIDAIDWRGYMANIEVNSVWAEALAAYQMGESADLTPEEQTMAEKINAAYEVEEPLEGIILQHFEIDPLEENWWTATKDILLAIDTTNTDPITHEPSTASYKGSTVAASMKLSSLMTALGCTRKKQRGENGKGNPQWGYVGVRKS